MPPQDLRSVIHLKLISQKVDMAQEETIEMAVEDAILIRDALARFVHGDSVELRYVRNVIDGLTEALEVMATYVGEARYPT